MEDNLSLNQGAVQRYEEQQGGSSLSVKSIDDIKRISLIFVKSGMFKGDNRLDQETKMYQAGVKIIAGVEFGIQPFAAMRGINIINGNAEMSANLMAAKVKSHPKYDYRVKQWDNEGCVLAFYEIPYPGAKRDEWDELGESSFDADDAKQAQLDRGDNWRKFARNMYFARAMSNGVRIHCPDVFYGAPVYTDGEISSESTPPPAERIQADNAQEESAQEDPEAAPREVVATEDATEPTEEAEGPTSEEPEVKGPFITDPQRKKIMALMGQLGVTTSEERAEVLTNVIERKVTSTNQLTKEEASRAIEALGKLKEEA